MPNIIDSKDNNKYPYFTFPLTTQRPPASKESPVINNGYFSTSLTPIHTDVYC